MRHTSLLVAVSLLALAPILSTPAWSQSRPRVDPAANAVNTPARDIAFAAEARSDGVLVLPLTSEADLAGVAALDPATREAIARAWTASEVD